MTNVSNETNTTLFFIDHIEPDFNVNDGTMILFCLSQEKGASDKFVKFTVSPSQVHEDIVEGIAEEMGWRNVHGSPKGLYEGLFIRVNNDVIGTKSKTKKELDETQFQTEGE